MLLISGSMDLLKLCISYFSYQLKWNQHVLRMPENRLPRKAVQYRSQGKMDLGRPYRRWKEEEEDFKY